MYIAAAYGGTIGTILFIAGETLVLPDFLHGVALGLMLGSLALLFVRRLRDEYFERLWNVGTSWAFATCVALFLAAPFVAKALGFVAKALGDSPVAAFRDYPGGWIGPLSILAFFAGFNWARFRG
jgi:hypothetical protein